MSALYELFKTKISQGLQKKAIDKPSKWAESHRMMGAPFPGKWSFRHHPWLKEMHDSQAVVNVGQKGAQLGFSECMLNLVFYNVDILRRDCLYVLPAKTPDATDFSASRFGAALELSEYLSRLFDDVQNIGHKRAGSVNLYVRGAKSRSGLKSIPAGFLVLDELDEMNKKSIELAMERQSGQLSRQNWKISTPTIENTGINEAYLESTQEQFFFKCPSCSKLINLQFPDNLVITGDQPNHPNLKNSHLICNECKAVLPHEEKQWFLESGIWVPQVASGITEVRGFHISQLYSPAITPGDIANLYLKSLTDASSEQEFYNSKLGLPHVVKGARVTEEDIKNCTGGYLQHVDGMYKTSKIVTLGADIGSKWNHIVIAEWDFPKALFNGSYYDPNSQARAKIIRICKVGSFEQIDDLMVQYGVNFAVVDAAPEHRSSYAFTQRFYNRAKRSFYANGVSTRQCIPTPEQDQGINVDRTSWLDTTLGRFHRGTSALSLPQDLDYEYIEHVKALAKWYGKDKEGNATSKYVTASNKGDHYAHAQNYAEIALPFALGSGVSTDIKLS